LHLHTIKNVAPEAQDDSDASADNKAKQIEVKSTKDFNAFHELFRSNDLQLGAGSNLLCEVPCISGEEPVRSYLEGRHEHRYVCLVMDQTAMPINFFLGREGDRLRFKEL